jgi:hypothetical protein
MVEKSSGSPRVHSTRLMELAWGEVDEPGCYLFIDTGDLVRIPTDALASGHSPLIALKSNREPRLARLSTNPSEPITVLRSIAADNDYFVNF